VDPRLVISTIVLVSYLAAARGVENLYPVSTFPMFSGQAGEAMSRIMARTSDGRFVEVLDLVAWKCDGPAAASCTDVPSIPYIDRERENHILSHSGTGGEPIELVRRIFSFDGVQRPEYCVITRCQAARR
jgi:hypothetical protein